MHFKFQIKSVMEAPEKEGDLIVRFTGLTEHLKVSDVLGSTTIIKGANRVQKFRTGLEVEDVKFNSFISTAEKPAFVKQIEEFKPLISEYYQGDEQISAYNSEFWKDPNIGVLKITNADLAKFFDTRNPEHALLYFNIMGGGYIDTIAPSRDIAEQNRVNFYIVTENEVADEANDDYITKAKAFSYLVELNNTADNEALLYLAWVLHSDTKSFGSYNKSTPKSELFKMHGEFIEGKLTEKKKRNCPKAFVDAAERWKDGKVGRPTLITEAYLRAADRLAYLNTDKEGRYSLPSGLQLDFTYRDSVDIILKRNNTKEYEALRDYVLDKWND